MSKNASIHAGIIGVGDTEWQDTNVPEEDQPLPAWAVAQQAAAGIATGPAPLLAADGGVAANSPQSGVPHDYFHSPEPQWVGTGAFEASTASWLADACLLTWMAPIEARMKLPVGWFLAPFGNDRSTSAGFVLHCAHTAVVAFRGMNDGQQTRFLNAYKGDARSPQQRWGRAQGAVHTGLYEALFPTGSSPSAGAWVELAAVLMRLQKPQVWFTGQGMGGAVATLAAANHGAPTGLYTFGAPAVGNSTFATKCALAGRYWRVACADDPTPRILAGLPFFGYSQFGRESGVTTFGGTQALGAATDPFGPMGYAQALRRDLMAA